MGQANAKVHNDTDQIHEVLSFNYLDGIRIFPQTKIIYEVGINWVRKVIESKGNVNLSGLQRSSFDC